MTIYWIEYRLTSEVWTLTDSNGTNGEPRQPHCSFLPKETWSYSCGRAFPGQQQPPTVSHQAQSLIDGSGGFGGPQKPGPTAMPHQCLNASYQANVAYDVGADHEQQGSVGVHAIEGGTSLVWGLRLRTGSILVPRALGLVPI